MRILRVYLAALLFVGVINTVGCSDGGGNDGFVLYPQGPTLAPAADITVANAQGVAATVVRAAEKLSDFATKIGGQIFPSLPSAPNLLSSNSKYEFIESRTPSGLAVTDTCASSGKVTVDPYYDWNKFDLAFNACDDGDGYTLNGSLSVTQRPVDGDPHTDVFQLGYEVSAISFTVTSDVESYTVPSVVLELRWDSVSFPEVALTASGALSGNSQGNVYKFGPWGGFLANQFLMLNADTSVSETQRGTYGRVSLESAFLGGAINYEIIVPLQAPDGQDPESGEILISEGLGGFLTSEDEKPGTIRFVIESSASVRLDIDADGDGIVDDFQYTTWAALRS